MRSFFVCVLLSVSSLLQAMEVSVQWAKFFTPDAAFVECYLHFGGQSFIAVESNGYKQAAVEVTILFKQGGEIIKFDRLSINSPQSVGAIPDFISQQRYGLEEGSYRIEVLVRDANDSLNVFVDSDTLEIKREAVVSLSDIQLLKHFYKDSTEQQGPFFKNGLFLETLPYQFVDKNISSLPYYLEIYGSQLTGKKAKLTTAIVPAQGEQNAAVKVSHKWFITAPIVPLVLNSNVADLPSGNYYLVLQLRNENDSLVATNRQYFIRSNPFLNFNQDSLSKQDVGEFFVSKLPTDSLKYSIRAIAMQITNGDADLIQTIYNASNDSMMRNYLLSYWLGVSPNHPEFAYAEYMKVARAIDNMYNNGFGYGFESDRGWMFLKYGRPDDLTAVENDPSAPPYEIWTYYQFPRTRQQNVKFVFWNPSLAGNGHQLLHSSARGERNNPRWQVDLYSRQAPNELDGNPVDANSMQDNWGRNAPRIYNDQNP
jgi:GWxTD domain-containing protein